MTAMTPAHQTGTCKSGDVTLFYRLLGKGSQTPILFVHGLSYFSYDWLEIAAAFGRPLRPLDTQLDESARTARSAVGVTIEAPDLCARYLARVVRGAKAAPSPAWLQKRLHTIGLVPKSNIVDASNYVLFKKCLHNSIITSTMVIF